MPSHHSRRSGLLLRRYMSARTRSLQDELTTWRGLEEREIERTTGRAQPVRREDTSTKQQTDIHVMRYDHR